MMIFRKAREHAEAIRHAGARAREQARATGTSISYSRRDVPGIIREWPLQQRIAVLTWRNRLEAGGDR